ncbi:histone methylation protein DOT1-domain-containing protein [Mycena metata]|uniref:Histone-lysine N-methyltransferase, H3 lysine-79 specific n=1 Tax=Mycena metata TaxID=1033252 RepID=A0AAD7IAR1_9AGAR|nr:histone methylation protein DOT1-domain-containing protein [Mycena metata]
MQNKVTSRTITTNMAPHRTTGDSRCAGPTSSLARQRRDGVKPELDDAPFSTPHDRECFLELAYDSLVSPDVHCVNGKSNDLVYGELLGKTLEEIADRGNLGPESTFLDIGGGIGQACLSLGIRSGCRSVTFEVAEAPSKLAMLLHRAIFQKCSQKEYAIGHHRFINADITDVESTFTAAISSATCILWNNVCFTPKLTEWIIDRLRIFVRPGTHLFVTKVLAVTQTRHSQDPWILLQDTFKGPCSWTKEIVVYHYIFQGRPSANITAASLHPTLLPRDEHWSPTYPPNELSCEIALPYFYYAVPLADPGVVHCRASWKNGNMKEEKWLTKDGVTQWVSRPCGRTRSRQAWQRKRDLNGTAPKCTPFPPYKRWGKKGTKFPTE